MTVAVKASTATIREQVFLSVVSGINLFDFPIAIGMTIPEGANFILKIIFECTNERGRKRNSGID
jgi:hypothetical protein